MTDNGEGMDRNTLEQIFDPFFTTKEDGLGTGLGLSVSYGIVREHGGRIHARSRKGEGSTFVIELPVCKEKGDSIADRKEEVADTRAEPSRKRRILVADDEPSILDLLMTILESIGHQVDTAANGEEASRKVRSNDYDLVIADVRMPRMNGIDLYRNILTMRPEMAGRVIFISGDLMNDETTQFLAEVNATAVAKPLEMPKFIQAVEETLRSPIER